MEHIKIPALMISYPVGKDMKNLTQAIRNYKAGFRYLKYPKGTQINLWCRGSSGAMFAAAFAFQFPQYDFRIPHVKKDGESCHNGYCVNYFKGDDVINVIIDDFMSSGDTVEMIMEKMKELKAPTQILILSTMRSNFQLRGEFEYIITGSNIEPV